MADRHCQAKPKDVYIYKMPYKERQEVVNILNIAEAWKELGGRHMGYSVVELEKFAMEGSKHGTSPADALLTHWGTRNHTVVQLYKHLSKMNHLQGMEAIKSLVPEKYHVDLRSTCSKTQATTVKVKDGPNPPPPPAINYYQATKGMEVNLDNNIDKGYSPHKFAPQEATATSPVRVNVVEESVVSCGANNRGTEVDGAAAISIPGGNGAGASSLNAIGSSLPSSIPSMIRDRNPSGLPRQCSEVFLQNVPFEELKEACDDFSIQNVIGRGGFGEVYSGRRHNQNIAVKRIRKDKRLMEDPQYLRVVNQFITELRAMHTFPGEHILPLLYYSFSDDFSTEPCLVYQLMPNGSVADRLKCKNDTRPLSWQQRAVIALGTASGLCHLHFNNIIHGDIKSGNILLDQHFKPYIGDFGLARGGPEDDASHKTVSCILGTEYYLPNDYRRSLALTPAVDTFCFGIVMFELVSGKSPSFREPSARLSLRDRMLQASSVNDHVDAKVGHDNWAHILFSLGKDCTKNNWRDRPSMDKVHSALEKLVTMISSMPATFVLQKFYDDRIQNDDAQASTNAAPPAPNVASQATANATAQEVELDQVPNILLEHGVSDVQDDFPMSDDSSFTTDTHTTDRIRCLTETMESFEDLENVSGFLKSLNLGNNHA